MESFVYSANPARVLFGSGTLQKLPEEVERLNLSAPLLLCTPAGKSLFVIFVEENIEQPAMINMAGQARLLETLLDTLGLHSLGTLAKNV